jgi:hypothetical protein
LSAKQEEETALSPEERAKKKRRETPFHEHYVRPMSFLEDAVRLGTSEFNLAGPNKPFGENQEAYARASYEEIVHTINRKRIQFLKSNIRAMAFIIRGSSGVGKSAFLGYAISRFRKFMPTIVIFHAPKIAKLGYIIELSAVQVSIWVGGKEQSRGVYPQMVDQVTKDNCTEYNFHLTVAWDLHHQKAQATQNGHVAFERQNNCSKRRFRRLRCQIPIQRDGQIQYLLREGPTNVDCAIVIGSLVIAVFIVQLSHHSISHRRYGLNCQSVFRSSSTSCCDVNSFELV